MIRRRPANERGHADHGWLDGVELAGGDGAAISEESKLILEGRQGAELLLFDLS